jgi:ketosteroid isomerase-like protein
MYMRTSLAILGFLQPLQASDGFAADAPNAIEQSVRDYVSAFNSRQIDVMMNMVSDDIQWLSVMGDKITVETQGKASLRESLTAYFKSTPSANSDLEWVRASASRVVVLERAGWQDKAGPKSQASLAVYEFSGKLISRVYYYPVEKND